MPYFDRLRLTMIAGLVEPYALGERPCVRRRKALHGFLVEYQSMLQRWL